MYTWKDFQKTVRQEFSLGVARSPFDEPCSHEIASTAKALRVKSSLIRKARTSAKPTASELRSAERALSRLDPVWRKVLGLVRWHRLSDGWGWTPTSYRDISKTYGVSERLLKLAEKFGTPSEKDLMLLKKNLRREFL